MMRASCPYCRSQLPNTADAVRYCDCRTLYHFECWVAHGRCSVFGCSAKSVVSIDGKLIPVSSLSIYDFFFVAPALLSIFFFFLFDPQELGILIVLLWFLCFYASAYFGWLIVLRGLIQGNLTRFQWHRYVFYGLVNFIPTYIGAVLHLLEH